MEAPPIHLDRDGDTPLHRQLYDQLRGAIVSGRLPPETRLPAWRRLSRDLGIARVTVERAYQDLAATGFVVGRHGSGTYVAPAAPRGASATTTRASSTPMRRLSAWGRRAADATAGRERAGRPLEIDFRPGAGDWAIFPRRVWWRLVGRRLRAGGALDRYGDPAGYPPLREAIARHLAATRSVACRADQVVVVNGTQQAVDLLSRILVEPGDRVVVEDPGYPEARQLFAAYGAELTPVPVGDRGLGIESMPSRAARLVYVTPSHQFPTGVTMPLESRVRLLTWAERHDSLVLEDDYDSEFRYAESPVESLQGLDRTGRVVYLGTFSTVLFSPLRVGYVVLPPDLVEPFVQAKWLADRGTGTLEQQALSDFLTEGHFGRHLRRIRRVGRARRDVLIDSLSRQLDDRVEIPPAHSGTHVMVRLPGVDTTALAQRAAAVGVSVYPAAPYYARRLPDPNALLLGFGGLTEEQIAEGIRLLARVV